MEQAPYDHKSNNPVAGIFVGGCLHWLAKSVDDSSWLISAFNIANKNFSQVPVANETSNGGFELGLLKGYLCMIKKVNGVMSALQGKVNQTTGYPRCLIQCFPVVYCDDV